MPAFLLLLLAAIFLPPKPDRYVTDRAFVLKDPNALNAKLANFERQTSDQILVYIDQRLPPHTTIEEMGSEAMRKWGVGQKGKDNGAILFVFVGDRKIRIEVGYGLEGSLTDAKSKWIASTVIKPAFQRGDFNGGVEEGVNAILATVRGEPYRGSSATVTEQSRHQSWDDRLIDSPFLKYLFFGGIFAAILFGIIASALRSGGSGGSGGLSDSWGASSSGSGSFSDSSSSSSSSSSDSFSGGGGSGGGGGASDSW